MTDKDVSDLQRLLGLLEGLCYGLDEKLRDVAFDAIKAFDELPKRIYNRKYEDKPR